MTAIINRGKVHGMLNGVFIPNDEVKNIVFAHIKAGAATKLIDTDETLMFSLIPINFNKTHK